MTALEKRIEAQATWVAIRMDYIDGWPRVTFTALAEQHGVSRHAIAKAAKRERWAFRARVIHAEKRARHAAEELAFAREQAKEIARALLRAAGDKRKPLEHLAAEAKEAGHGIVYVWTAAHWFADANRHAADAKAGRAGRHDKGALPDLDTRGGPASGGKDAPGRWPWYGYGPREPFPWEKRRSATA